MLRLFLYGGCRHNGFLLMTEIVAGIVTRIVLEKRFDLSLFRRRFLMRWFKRFFLPAAMVMAASAVWAESSYSIANFYEVIVPDSGTKAVGDYDKGWM